MKLTLRYLHSCCDNANKSITPKVLEILQPMVALKPWEWDTFLFKQTLKEWRRFASGKTIWATPSGLRLESLCLTCSQGFKANPGLELANTFGVKTFRQNKNFESKNRIDTPATLLYDHLTINDTGGQIK